MMKATSLSLATDCVKTERWGKGGGSEKGGEGGEYTSMSRLEDKYVETSLTQ